ncbi:HtaA domain-containing protein [Leucobacter luti]|uniref:HtaA domain-containing protein n=1 Tax=Leucobacter luti TaxID=340320 RepID=UPI001C6912DF|nr:HtaA domain-containing protein [Leucobacter luti]QYM77028.1 HtaA domain-containing protein [Leucobacter luti]
MNAHTKRRAGRRWAALSAAAVILAPVLGFGGATTALALAPAAGEGLTAMTTASTPSSGTLEWGVRTSIRNYLEQNGHTEGSVAAYDGATYAKGDPAASFPVTGGTVDPAAGTASLSFGGTFEMLGFGESWLHFTDLRLEVAGSTASLTVDLIESYNIKTRTDDLVISTFAVPSGGLAIADGQLNLTTERGKFSKSVAEEHLPSYGGPTYAAPNDYTDPIKLALKFGETTPATGPYGTSTGTAYADTTAKITVTPGYAVNAEDTTTLTVTGTGFDPGTAQAPSNIYVGLGTMTDQSKPEKWRRSAGGSSGPLGLADFTYGSTRLVMSHYAEDAAVADGVIDANGTWTLQLEVPGKNVPSFFGGEIDCVVNNCGMFSFGAHGAIKAVNEAYAPVFFDGQDSSTWPDRDGDGGTPPVVKPPVVKPPVVTPPVVVPPTGEKDCTPNGSSSTKNAAGAVLEVSPAKCLGDTKQTVTVTGTGYPTSRDGATFGGVYVLFGWVDQSNAKWAPSAGGSSGATYTYANDGIPAGTFQKMINFPGNTTGEGMPTMDSKGNWTLEMPIEASRFVSAQGKQIDCYEMTCGIITIGAHGNALAGGEAFTPVYFTGDAKDTGTKTPPTGGTTGPVANPNLQPTGGATPLATGAGAPAAGATGPLAKTGEEAMRGLVLWGVLLLSASVFTFATIRARRSHSVAPGA